MSITRQTRKLLGMARAMALLFPVGCLLWVAAPMSLKQPNLILRWLLTLTGAVGLFAPLLTTWYGYRAMALEFRRAPNRRNLRSPLVAALLFPGLLVIACLFFVILIAASVLPSARAASLGAAVCALILGIPALVWAGRALHQKLVRSRLDARALRIWAAGPVALMALVSAALVTGFVGSAIPDPSPPVFALTPESPGYSVLPTVRPLQEQLYWGGQQLWTVTSNGPVIEPWVFASSLSTATPQQRSELEDALRETWRDYRLEVRRNLTVNTNSEGHTVLSITTFSAAVQRLENRFWTRLDGVFTEPEEQANLRQLLARNLATPTVTLSETFIPVGQEPPRPLMALGSVEKTFEVWRVGSWYRWQEMSGMADRHGVGGNVGQDGRELPAEIAQLMEIAQLPMPGPPTF